MTHRINTDRTAAVSTETTWLPMESCPRGVRLLLLGAGGVAVIAQYDGRSSFWTGWAPLPRRAAAVEVTHKEYL